MKPQSNRKRIVVDLGGYWDIARERADAGADEYCRGFAAEKTVAVPSSINDLYTDHGWRTPEKPVWYYQRTFQPHDAWRTQRLVLRFGAVSYRAAVWLNGHFVGEHETGYTPFEFDVTGAMRWDGASTNLLVVRADMLLSGDTVPQGNIHASAAPGQMANQCADLPLAPARVFFARRGGRAAARCA